MTQLGKISSHVSLITVFFTYYHLFYTLAFHILFALILSLSLWSSPRPSLLLLSPHHPSQKATRFHCLFGDHQRQIVCFRGRLSVYIHVPHAWVCTICVFHKERTNHADLPTKSSQGGLKSGRIKREEEEVGWWFTISSSCAIKFPYLFIYLKKNISWCGDCNLMLHNIT